jgi:hypothetical protein
VLDYVNRNQRKRGLASASLKSGSMAASVLLCRYYGASSEDMAPWALFNSYRWSSPMSQDRRFDASRSLTALEQDSTIIAVIEMSQTKWLVPRKKNPLIELAD